jgi:inorganic pyrophosphatase
MNSWHDVSPGENTPSVINTVIEISKHSRMKYELDKPSGMLRLDRVVHTTNVYPGDYGFMPQTVWDDDDPLDVLVITDEGVLPNTVARVRVIGVLRMIDDGESDDKILGVYEDDPRYSDTTGIEDVHEHRLREIKHYFETYKDLQDKAVTVTDIDGFEAGCDAVEKGLRLYDEAYR